MQPEHPAETRLKEMLAAWTREYGPGGISSKRQHVLQVLIDHHGEPPSGGGHFNTPGSRTVADEVEDAVTLLQNTPTEAEPNKYWRAAMVLRVEYLTHDYWPESERLSKLGRIGIQISRHTYYRMLEFGKMYLMGATAQKRVA